MAIVILGISRLPGGSGSHGIRMILRWLLRGFIFHIGWKAADMVPVGICLLVVIIGAVVYWLMNRR